MVELEVGREKRGVVCIISVKCRDLEFSVSRDTGGEHCSSRRCQCEITAGFISAGLLFLIKTTHMGSTRVSERTKESQPLFLPLLERKYSKRGDAISGKHTRRAKRTLISQLLGDLRQDDVALPRRLETRPAAMVRYPSLSDKESGDLTEKFLLLPEWSFKTVL